MYRSQNKSEKTAKTGFLVQKKKKIKKNSVAVYSSSLNRKWLFFISISFHI